MFERAYIHAAIVISIGWFPSLSRAQPLPWDAFGDALSSVVEALNDKALEVEFDRAAQNLAPAIKRDICGKPGGAIVFADIYKGPGNNTGRRLRGLVHIPGECPQAAFNNWEDAFADSVLNVLPQGYESDAEKSFGLWVTCPSDELMSWQTIPWPEWVQMVNAEDPPCPMDFSSYGILAQHTQRVVQNSSVYFNVNYTVSRLGPGDVVATFSGWVKMEDPRNSVYTWFDSFLLPTAAEEWGDEEWKRFVEGDTKLPFVSAPTTE